MNQDTIAMINQIFQVCVIPLLGILTGFLVKYLRSKSEQLQTTTDNAIVKQYIQLAEETVVKAVIATNQTYVDNMKKNGVFDEVAQKTAFEKTKCAVIASLSDSAVDILNHVYGDFNAWLNSAIESAVKENKTVASK